MASTRRSILAAADFVKSSVSLPGEKGILTCARLSDSILSATAASAYGIIQLASSETPTPVPFCTLASGYLGGQAEIAWFGRIPLQPTFTIIGVIYGVQLREYHLSIYNDI